MVSTPAMGSCPEEGEGEPAEEASLKCGEVSRNLVVRGCVFVFTKNDSKEAEDVLRRPGVEGRR